MNLLPPHLNPYIYETRDTPLIQLLQLALTENKKRSYLHLKMLWVSS